jgi:undecaprenyl-diphosphatase
MQICERVKIGWIRRCAAITVYAFAVFMVIGRIFSGVHWITDIIGGALFSAGLVTAYSALVKVK